jgi:hypothetical protein
MAPAARVYPSRPPSGHRVLCDSLSMWYFRTRRRGKPCNAGLYERVVNATATCIVVLVRAWSSELFSVFMRPLLDCGRDKVWLTSPVDLRTNPCQKHVNAIPFRPSHYRGQVQNPTPCIYTRTVCGDCELQIDLFYHPRR